jgi:hypothetical protein
MPFDEEMERTFLIAASEAKYWATVDDPKLQQIAIGAMGAAANIAAAIASQVTLDQFQQQLESRARHQLFDPVAAQENG